MLRVDIKHLFMKSLQHCHGNPEATEEQLALAIEQVNLAEVRKVFWSEDLTLSCRRTNLSEAVSMGLALARARCNSQMYIFDEATSEH